MASPSFPTMTTLLRTGIVLIFSCASLATATEKAVQVDASRGLRLAVVDVSKATKARDALHAAFGDSLSEAISERCGGKVGVRVKCVSADSAAFNLGTGVYDAVLVVNSALPRPLMISGVARLNATLGEGRGEKKLYFVFGEDDATLAGLLAAAFPVAVNSRKFLDAVNDPNGGLGGAGGKLAATSP